MMALIYQAYYDAHGMWPDYATAKALLMSTSTDLDYDTFTQALAPSARIAARLWQAVSTVCTFQIPPGSPATIAAMITLGLLI
ncbi:MAG: hypothetical protein R2856_18800 [Caldilineaceae bacterium]